MKLFDTHAHLFSDMYGEKITPVLSQAREVGVVRILNVGIDLETSREVCSAAGSCEEGPDIKAGVGIHPGSADQASDKVFRELRALSAESGVIAVGETGLDFYRNGPPPDVQRSAFQKHIELSLETGLPLVIHSRSALAETRDVLREYKEDSWSGVMHCFGGSASDARMFLDMGFMISFAGNLTFPKALELRKAFDEVPEERLLMETDSPYLAPQRYRGKKNQPAWIAATVEYAAGLRKTDFARIAEITLANANRLFGL